MGVRLSEKMYLSARGLLKTVRGVFGKVTEPKANPQGPDKEITIGDCLMSSLAIFKLKYPSLLQFETSKSEPVI